MNKDEAIYWIKTIDALGIDDGAGSIVIALKMATDALQEQQWIACSERLPSEEEKVLVCSDTGNMCVTHGCKYDSLDGEFEFFTPGWKFGEVIAWMPLPTPPKN